MTPQFRSFYHGALRRILASQGSRFVRVDFVKADGSYRKMLIQHAALKARVKGETAPAHKQQAAETRAEIHPELFNTFDVDRGAIRSINLDTIISIRSGRTLYQAPAEYFDWLYTNQ